MAVRVVIRWRMKLLWSCCEAELCGERSWLAVEVAEQVEQVAELCQELCLLLSASWMALRLQLIGNDSLQLSGYTIKCNAQ